MKPHTIFILLVCSLNLNAAEVNETQLQQIDQLIQTQATDQTPGFAIGIVHNGQVAYQRYQGMANLNDNIPVSSKTKFNYASVAKQITAYMLLELCTEKGIPLDADFRTYLPDYFPGIRDRISIKNLISHTSGIRDYPELMSLKGKTWWKQLGLNNRAVLQLIKQQQTLNFKPGTAYSYSNTNYIILSELISQLSTVDFHAYSDAFFQRMGMNDTHFNRGYMRIVKHQALPYSSWEPGVWQQYPMLSDLKGDGFLHTTLPDQLKWETHLQQQTDHQIQQLIQKPLYTATDHNYGFGLEFNDYYGQPSIQHSGSTGSFNAHLLRLPESATSIVVMSNNGGLSSQQMAEASANILLGIDDSNNKPATAQILPFGGENKYPKTEWVGNYLLSGHTFLDITLKGGDLYREITDREPIKLIPKGSDIYQYEGMDFLHIAFAKQQDQITFKLHQTGLTTRTAEKYVPVNLSQNYLNSIKGGYHSAELDRQFILSYLGANAFRLTYNNQNDETTMRKKGLLIFDDFQLKVDSSSLTEATRLYLDYQNSTNIPWIKTDK